MRAPRLSAALLALAAAVGPADAQPSPPPGPPRGEALRDERDAGRREKLRERLSAYMTRRLAEQLDLTEAESARLEPLLREREIAHRSFLRQRRELQRDIAIAADDTSVSDETLQAKVAALRDLEAAFHDEERRREERILATMSPRQQTKYLAFMERFPKELQRKLKELREKGELPRRPRRGEGRDGPFRRRRAPSGEDEPDSQDAP